MASRMSIVISAESEDPLVVVQLFEATYSHIIKGPITGLSLKPELELEEITSPVKKRPGRRPKHLTSSKPKPAKAARARKATGAKKAGRPRKSTTKRTAARKATARKATARKSTAKRSAIKAGARRTTARARTAVMA